MVSEIHSLILCIEYALHDIKYPSGLTGVCPLIAQLADSLDPELYIRNDLFEYIPDMNLFLLVQVDSFILNRPWSSCKDE